MRIRLPYAAAAILVMLVSGCAPAQPAGPTSQPTSEPVPLPVSELVPDAPLELTVPSALATPGSTITVHLRVQEPERIAHPSGYGSFTGWICFRDCSDDGASEVVTFVPSPDDPHLFTAEVTVPVILRRSVGPTVEGKGSAEAVFEPVAAGELPIHAACILDREGGCAHRSEASSSIALSQGVATVAWEDLPPYAVTTEPTPVPRLGTLSDSARSPVPDSLRSTECITGNLDPRMGQEPPRLLRTDDAGQPLPPIILGGEGNPLYGRHGYAGCGALALDPVQTDTFYLMESPHAGGAEPGAFPWPQFTQDAGATWAPVPAPEGFEAGRTFVGFASSADGVIAWFSQASLEEGAEIAGEQIRGSLTRDGGRTWTTVAPACPEGSTGCVWQLRDRPPMLASGLIRSSDGGKTWSWAALSGIPFTAAGVYAAEGSGGQLLEAVNVSPARYGGFASVLRSEDGGVTWRYVKVPDVPGGWYEYPGYAPEIRIDAGGALLVGKRSNQGLTGWYRLERGSTEWVEVRP